MGRKLIDVYVKVIVGFGLVIAALWHKLVVLVDKKAGSCLIPDVSLEEDRGFRGFAAALRLDVACRCGGGMRMPTRKGSEE